MRLIHILGELEDSLLALEQYKREHPNEDVDKQCTAFGIREHILRAGLCQNQYR